MTTFLIGEHDSSSSALKQTPPALVFELANLTADMRLACAVRPGRLAKAPDLSGMNEKLPLEPVRWHQSFNDLLVGFRALVFCRSRQMGAVWRTCLLSMLRLPFPAHLWTSGSESGSTNRGDRNVYKK